MVLLQLGLLVGALVVGMSGFAQSAPPRIVQSSDGTLFLLKDGARYQVDVEMIDDEDLAAYTDGGMIGASAVFTVAQTQTAVAREPAPAPEAPAVADQQP